MLEIAIL